MKYLVIGSVGVGGTMAALLAKKNYDVSLIAHGLTYEAIKNNGLTLDSEIYGKFNVKIKCFKEEDYNETPDCIIVAVKGYSLLSIIPLLKRITNDKTIVIPLLNIYGTGEYLAKKINKPNVLDGCIYVMSDIIEHGVIKNRVCEIRLVFGYRNGLITSTLKTIEADFKNIGITPILSSDVKKDTFLKYALISTMAGVGLYYNATVGEVLDDPVKVEFFKGLSKEIETLGKAMGINYPFSLVERNMELISLITRDGTTSLQKDFALKKETEFDGLIKEVVVKGKMYNLDFPCYNKILFKESVFI